MNYLMKKSDVRKALALCEGVMHSGSVFMFDITTENNIETTSTAHNTYDIREIRGWQPLRQAQEDSAVHPAFHNGTEPLKRKTIFRGYTP
jgi:GH24 family phage-related lysozyme (muramidase)